MIKNRRSVIWLLMIIIVLIAAGVTAAEAEQEMGREIIATGDMLWQVVDQTVLTTSLSTGKVIGSLGIGEMSPAGTDGLAIDRYDLMAGRSEETVTLLTVYTDENGKATVITAEMQAADDGGGIRVLSTEDRTGTLGTLYDEDGDYMQADPVRHGKGIYLSALDEGFSCHLFFWEEESGTLTEMGELPFAMLTAACPYDGERMLLAGDSMETDGALSMALLSVPEGELTEIGEISAGATVPGQNYAYDPENNKVYYTLRNTAYRVTPESGAEPEKMAVFPEEPGTFANGAIAGGRYAVQTEDGKILQCGIHDTLEAKELRIANLTEDETGEAAAAVFNGENPGTYLSVDRFDPEEEPLFAALEAYDAVIMDLNSESCREMMKDGYAADLGTNEGLRSAADAMNTAVRERLETDGTLRAFPVAQANSCLTLNTEGIREMTGLTADEAPGDWVSLLEMMGGIAESGSAISNSTYRITEAGITAERFRLIMLGEMLQSAVLREEGKDPGQASLREVVAPALEAFQKVNWHGLGLPEEEADEDGEEKTPILSESEYEISTMYLEDGIVFQPMAMVKGEEGTIPQQVTVVLVRDGENRDAMIRWVETISRESDQVLKMSLCPGMNEPIPNDEYEDAVAYYEMMITFYDEMIAETGDEAEAAELQEEQEEIRAYLAAYRENAKWSASEESIAAYRAMRIIPEAEILSSSEGIGMMIAWLDGEIGDEELIAYLESIEK